VFIAGQVPELAGHAGHRLADLAGDDMANFVKSSGAMFTPYSGLPRKTVCYHLIRPSELFFTTTILMGSSC
jgi:hypothetical protein